MKKHSNLIAILFAIFDVVFSCICTRKYLKQLKQQRAQAREINDPVPITKHTSFYYISLIVSFVSLFVYYYIKYMVIDFNDEDSISDTEIYPISYFISLCVYYSSMSAVYSMIMVVFVTSKSKSTSSILLSISIYVVAFSAWVSQTAASLYYTAKYSPDTIIDRVTGEQQCLFTTTMNKVNAVSTSAQMILILVILGLKTRKTKKKRTPLHQASPTPIATKKTPWRLVVTSIVIDVYLAMNLTLLFIIYQLFNIMLIFFPLLTNAVKVTTIINLIGNVFFSLLFIDPETLTSVTSKAKLSVMKSVGRHTRLI
eukprot:gnl/Dysnectes_brevis/5866_a8718_436.p1 GENE.gnl/Dysnectes_brevis/5866_a8718_436~~gnl/Dysnectes_brevis/5866_a8718_436.p1  ORF type:complete len:312 (-),score=7.88 gnl/Dysnectes_brevis/5866_a8718_436:85-1020(-)